VSHLCWTLGALYRGTPFMSSTMPCLNYVLCAISYLNAILLLCAICMLIE
jgi:hypothetical protein